MNKISVRPMPSQLQKLLLKSGRPTDSIHQYLSILAISILHGRRQGWYSPIFTPQTITAIMGYGPHGQKSGLRVMRSIFGV